MITDTMVVSVIELGMGVEREVSVVQVLIQVFLICTVMVLAIDAVLVSVGRLGWFVVMVVDVVLVHMEVVVVIVTVLLFNITGFSLHMLSVYLSIKVVNVRWVQLVWEHGFSFNHF